MKNPKPFDLFLDILLILIFICLPIESIQSQSPFQAEKQLNQEIQDALDLYLRHKGHLYKVATDPYEIIEHRFTFETFIRLMKQKDYDRIFLVADEVFEVQTNAKVGAVLGPISTDQKTISPLTTSTQTPAQAMPIHQGEYGGADGNACRSCHFSGGADGAGNATQKAFFRGDGKSLKSASQREAPHVMGLGYLKALAVEMENELKKQIDDATEMAKVTKSARLVQLSAKDVHFGSIIIDPFGEIKENHLLEGISKDLKIRPFGWKGRFSDLVLLCDEALQIHHGLQSASRIAYYVDDPILKEKYLGKGSKWDPDQDTVEQELPDGQALMLATYLSMLPMPQMKSPKDFELMTHWANGRKVFEKIGCASCHRPKLYLENPQVPLNYPRNEYLLEYPPTPKHALPSDWQMILDLNEAGLDPKPRRIDFTPNANGQIEAGVPIFAFTDLKRHDLGEALADVQDEVLPDTQEVIDKRLWLTRPLWGLADTGPYLHDGRAQDIHEAIEWHGGEALESKNLYLQLAEEQKAELRAFLMSLSRESVILIE